MTMIDNVERYITFKRHLGFKFVLDARTLRAFAHEAVDCSDGIIRAASVIAWARKTSTAGQARIRLRIVCDLEAVSKGAYILNLTGGNPALASVGTNVTQRPMTGKTTLRRPHCN